MIFKNSKKVVPNLKTSIVNQFWKDEIDNDAEDFEEEWIPQEAW